MAGKVNKTSGETTTYIYDAENKLVGVTSPVSNVTYKYDALGRRIEKNVNGNITKYVYNGEDIIQEYDGVNNIAAGYTHGAGIDEPISTIRYTLTAERYFYLSDGLGSITAITDASGTTVNTYRYDSFGNILSSTGSLSQPYTFTGREYDAETGIYYYRARYYDAKIGRFLQEDPIWDVNLYPYCNNNPVNFFDPFGLKMIFKGWYKESTLVDRSLYAIAKDTCSGDVYLVHAAYENYLLAEQQNYSTETDMKKLVVNIAADVYKMMSDVNKYGLKTKLEYLQSSPKIKGQQLIEKSDPYYWEPAPRMIKLLINYDRVLNKAKE